MSESLAVTTLRVCASLAACVLFASLVPAIRTVQREKSTATMPSALPVLSMVANCVAWGLYGLLIEDFFPLVATNAVGLSLSLFYLVVYYKNASNKGVLREEILVTVVLMLLLIAYPFGAEHMGAKRTDVQDVVGVATIAISSVMFGSPLVLVKRVIQERNTELLPLAMIVAGAVNCALWLAYGLLQGDVFVIVPNAANLLLGVVQLGLFCVFPRGAYDSVENAASTTRGSKRDAKEGSVTDLETDDDLERSSSTVDVNAEPASAADDRDEEVGGVKHDQPAQLEEAAIEVR